MERNGPRAAYNEAIREGVDAATAVAMVLDDPWTMALHAPAARGALSAGDVDDMEGVPVPLAILPRPRGLATIGDPGQNSPRAMRRLGEIHNSAKGTPVPMTWELNYEFEDLASGTMKTYLICHIRPSDPREYSPTHARRGAFLQGARVHTTLARAWTTGWWAEPQKEEDKMMLRSDLPCMRNIVLRMVGPESQHVVWLMNPPWAHSYNFGLDRAWQEALGCVATFGRTMLMHSQMQVEHPPRPLHVSWR